MTIAATIIRGARSAYRAAVTLDGREVGGRLFPLDGMSRGITLVGNQHATYEELYRTQIWVHTVVNRLARSIARLPLKVYVNPDEPGERERVREGALAELLERPGPRLGINELKQEIVSNVAIHGNCVLVKRRPRPGAPVTELIPSSYAYWRPTRGQDGEVTYWFRGHGAAIPFRPEEVIHFHWWKPGNGLEAPSPLEALRTTLMVEDAAQRLAIAAFENGNRPEGAFSIEGHIDKARLAELRERLQEVYGGVDNAFKLAILTHGAKWLPMSHNMVDSELINLRKLSREEVAAAYNVPPPVIGILDRATFSNITEQHLMEYMDTIQPWGAMIEEAFAVQLIADEPLMVGQYAEFDYGGVLAGDPVKQVEVLTKAVGGPIFTPDEARARLNMPPLNTPQSSTLAPPANASIKGGESGGDS